MLFPLQQAFNWMTGVFVTRFCVPMNKLGKFQQNWWLPPYVKRLSGYRKLLFILRLFRMGHKLLNSFEDDAICVAIQTHIAKKEIIQG